MLLLCILSFQIIGFAHAFQNTDVQLKLHNLETLMAKRLSIVEASLAEQKEDNSKMKLEISRQVSQLSKLEQNLETKQSEIIQLNKDLAFQKSDNMDIKKEIGDMKKLVSNLSDRRQEQVRNIMVGEKERRLLLADRNIENRIAFYAYLSRSETILNHKTLIYDVTMVNYANGYNNNTGTFTAPLGGVYVLTTTIHPNVHSYATVDIVVNNKIEGTIFSDSSVGTDRNAATGIVVVFMNQGDVGFVRTHPTQDSRGTLYSTELGRCSFAGWKISD